MEFIAKFLPYAFVGDLTNIIHCISDLGSMACGKDMRIYTLMEILFILSVKVTIRRIGSLPKLPGKVSSVYVLSLIHI